MTVLVVTAGQAAARDAAAIDAGVPSHELMRRAGEGAARAMRSRYGAEMARGVVVSCGTGNNGGDGWVVADALRAAGVSTRVVSLGAPRGAAAADAARRCRREPDYDGDRPGVVVDALLGTGSRGAPRGEVLAAVERIVAWREGGARVVSLDLPTGVDADGGDSGMAVTADLTVSMGTVKRGHLASRARCGDLVVIDIGLGSAASLADGPPRLAEVDWVRERVPRIAADAHKGGRRRVLIVGGARGMAGAVAYAGRAALRSGIGMVRLCVHPDSLAPVQVLVPQATAAAWPGPGEELADPLGWAHALLLGPGLGDDVEVRLHVERWLGAWGGPVVIDAGGLSCFGADLDGLARHLRHRAAVLTPHAGEAARLLATTADEVLRRRYEVVRELSARVGATVLLKGVPTLVASPDGDCRVVARGTPVLAQGGSGDALGGVLVTLLAQTGDAMGAAAAAAWVHGRAAEVAHTGRVQRGLDLDDVLAALPEAWRLAPDALGDGELAFLPAVRDA